MLCCYIWHASRNSILGLDVFRFCWLWKSQRDLHEYHMYNIENRNGRHLLLSLNGIRHHRASDGEVHPVAGGEADVRGDMRLQQ